MRARLVASLRLLTAVAGLGIVGAAQHAAGEDLTLVEDGKPRSVIVIPRDWFQWQKLAADELQYHLRRMSGATVPVVTEDRYKEKPGGTLILVAQGQRVSELGIDTTKLEPETLIIKAIGNVLVLAGEDGTQNSRLRKPREEDLPPHSLLAIIRTGSLFAVYELLEKQLGCRWVFPGDLGAVVPKRATVTIPGDLDIRRTPRLAQRHMRSFLTHRDRHVAMYTKGLRQFPDLLKVYDQLSSDEGMWMLRMRLGRRCYIPYGHAFTKWWELYGKARPVPPEIAAMGDVLDEPGEGEGPDDGGGEDKLPEDGAPAKKASQEVEMQPGQVELFALQPDGSRGCQKGGNPEYVKMCVSNPAFWDLLIERFQKQLEASPDIPLKVLNICENDGGSGFCTCDRCRAWDASVGGKPRMQRGKVILSARYARFFNEMAKRVREVHPDAWVVAYAYSWYQPAPRTVTVAPNALIGITDFSRYPMSEGGRAHARRTYAGWARGGARMILRPNAFHYLNGRIPFVVTHEMADDLAFMLERNLWGTDFDGFFGYWATSGPTNYVVARMQWDTDADVERLLDEYYRAFGLLGPIVREYFDFWEQKTKDGVGDRPAALARGRRILDKAQPLLEKADPDDVERFRNIEHGLTHAELMRKARRPTEGEEDREALLKAAKELMDFRHEVVARNVTNVLWLTLQDVGSRRSLVRDIGARGPDGKYGPHEHTKAGQDATQELDALQDGLLGDSED